MKNFNGKVLFIDRSDVNTDEIAPAVSGMASNKEQLKPLLLGDLKYNSDFSYEKDIVGKNIIITKANYGCGSSREQAVWAHEINGINVVIAENFARIFKKNMINCGMPAISLSKEVIESLFDKFANLENVSLEMDIENESFRIYSGSVSETVSFELTDFEKTVIKAGGWFDYIDKNF